MSPINLPTKYSDLKNPIAINIECLSGIYFFIDNNEIVYIGAGEIVYTRIGLHAKKGMPFTSIQFIPIQKTIKEIIKIESDLIKHFRPKFNLSENPDNFDKTGAGGRFNSPEIPNNELGRIAEDLSIDHKKQLLSILEPVQAVIVSARYNFFGQHLTLRRLGELHNRSIQTIAQIHKKALNKIYRSKEWSEIRDNMALTA